VIGGGAVGSAAAYWIRRLDPACRVVVVERDPTYVRASSQLSASGIRQQFTTPANVALSQFGVSFLRDAPQELAVDGEMAPDLAFRERGYLTLATRARLPALEAAFAVQRGAGADVEWLDERALATRFPWLVTDDLAAAVLGRTGEGWFDGPGLHASLRRKARALGAAWIKGEAIGFERSGSRIAAVMLADGGQIQAGKVVNAAGPYARAIAALADISLPVEARKRIVFNFYCREPVSPCPLVIDPSGVWFRPEGSGFIGGFAPEEDPEDFALDVDHDAFEQVLWPNLAARVRPFEAVRVAGAWAGHYEYCTWDQNALLGTLPETPNLVFANGFSGHGMQHAVGAGRGVAEWVLYGEWRSLDLSTLEVGRLREGRRVVEGHVI
jgi:FAD-dependent oxidoreductase domain-containing protein 1